MKFDKPLLLISIAAALVIFGLTMFLILQFSFMVGIIAGLSSFLVLTVCMMIINKKKK